MCLFLVSSYFWHLLGMLRLLSSQIADRLHNMRTIWALSDVKQRALAEETLAVWCNLASRLGLASVKAELEDLAFCVLNPAKFGEIQRGIEHCARVFGEYTCFESFSFPILA